MAEREKRRATTFRTSKGTIVNVAAPTVYVSPAFLSTEDVTNPTELREALRDELGKQLTTSGFSKYPETLLSVPGKSLTTPFVLKVDGLYYMFYGYWDPVTGGGDVRYATATDGIKFTPVGTALSPGAPGSWDERRVEAPYVFYSIINNAWNMFFAGWNAAGVPRIGYATAPAVTGPWSKHAGNPVLTVGGAGAWDERRVYSPNIVRLRDPVSGADRNFLTYVGSNAAGVTAIGVAVANDIITFANWTKYTRNPVLELSGHLNDWDSAIVELHRTVRVGDWFVMLYEANGIRRSFTIGLAFSKDCYHWAKSWMNPIMYPSSSNGRDIATDWGTDSYAIVHPHLLIDTDGSFKLYYISVTAKPPLDHVISLAYLNGNLLKPEAEPFKQGLGWKIWSNEAVVGATNSYEIPCRGYTCKTLYFLSNTTGTLTIQVDPIGNGGWVTYSTEAVTANIQEVLPLTGDFTYLRISFSVNATLTASLAEQ